MGPKDCTAGSTNYDQSLVGENTTYILIANDYKVNCEGKVFAWEFCYQAGQNDLNRTFYPGIWEKGKGKEKDKYSIKQSNMVTFNPTENMSPCQMFNLPTPEQFTAPKDSFIGLYSNTGSTRPLLFAYNNNGKTYQSIGNHSKVDTKGLEADNFNIAIRVHISEFHV